MDTQKKFMRTAIRQAQISTETLPCGAVIVKEGKIIAKAFNTARRIHDASAHAEINVIRKAGKKLKTKDLMGCTIYCTCEPCVMCLSAITYAKIQKIVYGLTLREVTPKEKLIDIDLEYFLSKITQKIEVEKNYMNEECKVLIKTKC